MSLAQPPTFHAHSSAGSSTFGGPGPNPFGPHAYLGSDQRSLPSDRGDPESDAEPIHAPQGRVPVTMPTLAPPPLSATSSRPDSRPDFARGFGLDATEEEDETEDEGQEAEYGFLTNSDSEHADGEESEPEDGEGLRTARHSRHVSRLSAALSLRSVGGVGGAGLNARTDVAPGDTSQDMDLDVEEAAAEWTSSSVSEQGGNFTSEDEVSVIVFFLSNFD
jgi:hypothetical protein